MPTPSNTPSPNEGKQQPAKPVLSRGLGAVVKFFGAVGNTVRHPFSFMSGKSIAESDAESDNAIASASASASASATKIQSAWRVYQAKKKFNELKEKKAMREDEQKTITVEEEARKEVEEQAAESRAAIELEYNEAVASKTKLIKSQSEYEASEVRSPRAKPPLFVSPTLPITPGAAKSVEQASPSTPHSAAQSGAIVAQPPTTETAKKASSSRPWYIATGIFLTVLLAAAVVIALPVIGIPIAAGLLFGAQIASAAATAGLAAVGISRKLKKTDENEKAKTIGTSEAASGTSASELNPESSTAWLSVEAASEPSKQLSSPEPPETPVTPTLTSMLHTPREERATIQSARPGITLSFESRTASESPHSKLTSPTNVATAASTTDVPRSPEPASLTGLGITATAQLPIAEPTSSVTLNSSDPSLISKIFEKIKADISNYNDNHIIQAELLADSKTIQYQDNAQNRTEIATIMKEDNSIVAKFNNQATHDQVKDVIDNLIQKANESCAEYSSHTQTAAAAEPEPELIPVLSKTSAELGDTEIAQIKAILNSVLADKFLKLVVLENFTADDITELSNKLNMEIEACYNKEDRSLDLKKLRSSSDVTSQQRPATPKI